MGRLSQSLAALIVAFVPVACGIAADPDSAAAKPDSAVKKPDSAVAAKPTAAELVEGILAEESKIDTVRSLYLRFDITKMQPESVERKLEIIRRESPGEEIDVAGNVALWPKLTETLELAFDEKRLRLLRQREGDYRELCIFDGEWGARYGQLFIAKTETRDVALTLDQLKPEDFFAALLWPRMRPRQFWFMKGRKPDKYGIRYGQPSDYWLGNQVAFRGRPCYVLENRSSNLRLHVGVDDRHLHGITELMMPRGADELAVVSKLAGESFAAKRDFQRWLNGLSDEERAKFSDRFEDELFAQARPCNELYLEEYFQLVPGLWFPAAQGSCFTDLFDPKPYVLGRVKIRLAEVKVNQPLDDSLFAPEAKDAAK